MPSVCQPQQKRMHSIRTRRKEDTCVRTVLPSGDQTRHLSTKGNWSLETCAPCAAPYGKSLAQRTHCSAKKGPEGVSHMLSNISVGPYPIDMFSTTRVCPTIPCPHRTTSVQTSTPCSWENSTQPPSILVSQVS